MLRKPTIRNLLRRLGVVAAALALVLTQSSDVAMAVTAVGPAAPIDVTLNASLSIGTSITLLIEGDAAAGANDPDGCGTASNPGGAYTSDFGVGVDTIDWGVVVADCTALPTGASNGCCVVNGGDAYIVSNVHATTTYAGFGTGCDLQVSLDAGGSFGGSMFHTTTAGTGVNWAVAPGPAVPVGTFLTVGVSPHPNGAITVYQIAGRVATAEMALKSGVVRYRVDNCL